MVGAMGEYVVWSLQGARGVSGCAHVLLVCARVFVAREILSPRPLPPSSSSLFLSKPLTRSGSTSGTKFRPPPLSRRRRGSARSDSARARARAGEAGRVSRSRRPSSTFRSWSRTPRSTRRPCSSTWPTKCWGRPETSLPILRLMAILPDRSARPTLCPLPYSRIKGKNKRQKGKLATSPYLSLCIPAYLNAHAILPYSAK